jgi:hypothetical protein
MAVIITGNNTPTAGGITYGDGSTYANTAAGTSGQPVVSGGAGAPAFRPYTLPAADGSASQVLQTNGSGALSFATVSAGAGNQGIIVNTGNGFGSTNTLIRRFSTTQSSVGSDITYADSATLGASFTINTTAIYAMSYTERLSSAGYFGISVNSTELTTAIESITDTDRFALQYADNGNGARSVSVTARLAASDVVRAHTSITGTFQASFAQVFRIRKVGTI